MALGIDRSVAAIRPIVFAVVGRLRLVADRRARRTRAFAVHVDIINEDADRLGDLPVLRSGADVLVGPLFAAGAAHHDQALAVDQLRVFDTAALALDFQLHLEVEGLAQPIDRRRRVVIEEGDRDSGPALGRWFHDAPMISQ